MKRQQVLLQLLRMRLRALSLVSKRKAGDAAFRIFCTPFSRMSYSKAQMEPAEVLSFQFKGQTTVGYRWNKGGTQKLLIAHGFSSASFNFRHLALLLAEKGYEVIAFDAPAHGLSEGKTLNAVDYKDFIQTVEQRLGPFHAWLGHSFGGLAMALALSDIPNNEDKKIVWIAPAANARQLTESFFAQLKIENQAVKDFFYAHIDQIGGHSIDWYSIGRCASLIKSQVFWVHDHNDNITPIADALAVEKQGLPHFHFLFTSHLGHRRIYRDEKVIEQVVQFL